MAIKLAVKPKYPTRKAIDKVLLREENFVDIIDIESKVQATTLTATSHIAIINDNKYYPIEVEDIDEQFDLAKAGQAPTVEEDATFGIKKLNTFVSAGNQPKIQDDIEIYNGIINGILYKVTNSKTLGINGIDKNGFWIAINVDLTSAGAEGYSEIKLNGTTLVNGENLIFLGEDDDKVNKTPIYLVGTLTIEDETSKVEEKFDKKFSTTILGDKAVAAVVFNEKEYDTLAEALAAAGANGGLFEINKSQTMSASYEIKDGQTITLMMNNKAKIEFNSRKSFLLTNGSLIIMGNGIISDKNNTYSAIKCQNTSNDNSAYVYIGKDITVSGAYGIFATKETTNTTIDIHGTVNGINAEWGGVGLYVNGTADDVVINLNDAVITAGDMAGYIAGKAVVNVNGDSKLYGEHAGVEIRAGELNVFDNASISCNPETELSMTPSGNGSATTGGAIGIAQHTTKLPISVNIIGGTISGNAGIYEGNPQDNPTATKDTSINVINGTIIGATASVLTVDKEKDCQKFLSGGKYNNKPDAEYIADGFCAKKTSSGTYVVKAKSEDEYFLESLNIEAVEDEDYIYTAEYSEYDYVADNNFMKQESAEASQYGCSEIQVGNIRGRNFDWTYNNNAGFIIKTPAGNGRHAVLGVTGYIKEFTKQFVDSKEYTEAYRHMASFIVDGINDAGLCVGINMLPFNDTPSKSHTRKGAQEICNLMICRYLLDNASTIDECIKLLKSIDIWHYAINGIKFDLHYLITDISGKSIVVEIINGEINVVEDNIMTNYYQTIPMTPHSEGIERFNILKAGESGVTNVETMINLMKSIRFTKAYDTTVDPFWYSDFNGVDDFGDLTIDSPVEAYAEKISAAVEEFNNRSRDTGKTWQTVHTSVYDIENKTLDIIVQEGTSIHHYEL